MSFELIALVFLWGWKSREMGGTVTPPISHNNSASIPLRMSSLQKLLNLGLDHFSSAIMASTMGSRFGLCVFSSPKGLPERERKA